MMIGGTADVETRSLSHLLDFRVNVRLILD